MTFKKSLRISKVEPRKRVRSRVHFVSDMGGPGAPVLVTLTVSPRMSDILKILCPGSRWDIVLRGVAPDAPLFRKVQS